MQAMLNTVLNSCALSEAPLLKALSIIKITSYTVNKTKEKKIFLLLNFDRESVQPMDSRIGEPVNIEKENLSGEALGMGAGAGSAMGANANPRTTTASYTGTPSTSTSYAATSTTSYTAVPSTTASTGNALHQQSSTFNNPMNSTYSNSHSTNTTTSNTNVHQQPPKKLMLSTGDADAPIHPIASLTPYNNKWAIKARVTQKSEIKTWSNAKGEGKLFNMTLMDASGEIKCTAFKEAAETFHPRFEVGKVYLIGKGTVKMANTKYAASANAQASNASAYEMQLEKTSYATLVPEDSKDNSIPAVKYAFVPIQEAANMEKDCIIDVIGVVKECSEPTSIRSKTTQKQLVKRDVTIVDLSSHSIKVTLWGDTAESFKAESNNATVVAFKGVRLTEFNGKSLSTISSTSIALNPAIHEAYELRGWYEAQGFSLVPHPLSTAKGGSLGIEHSPYAPNDPRTPLSQLKEQIASSDRGEYFSITGCIGRIRHTNGVSYPACPTEGCNKKVFEMGPSQWKCEKCNQVYPSCNHRYMFSMCVNDYSGNVWVNVFDEGGLVIFGERKAEELVYLRQNDEAAFDQVIRDCEHKMARFRLRAKSEYYQGEQKMRYSLVSVHPVSFEAECKGILGVIAKYQ